MSTNEWGFSCHFIGNDVLILFTCVVISCNYKNQYSSICCCYCITIIVVTFVTVIDLKITHIHPLISVYYNNLSITTTQLFFTRQQYFYKCCMYIRVCMCVCVAAVLKIQQSVLVRSLDFVYTHE